LIGMPRAYRVRACALRRLLMAGGMVFLLSGPDIQMSRAAENAFTVITELDGRFSASDRLMAESDAAMAATIDVLSDMFGPVTETPGTRQPTRVTLYRRSSSYQSAIRRVGAGAFEENLAFTDYGRRESHVALQPPCRREVIRGAGLPLLTKRQIAHEVAHLWCDRRWPRDYRAAPRWLREGLATWASEAAMRKLGAVEAAEDDPFLASRMVMAQRVGDRLGAIAPPSRANDPFAADDRRTSYALDWAWCRWRLDAARPGTNASLRNVSMDELIAFLCRDAAVSMGQFATYVRSFRPAWDQVARSLERRGDAWLQFAFPGVDAIAWRRRGPAHSVYRIGGALRFLSEDDPGAKLLFARDADGYLAVVFERGRGLAIRRFNERLGEWAELARSDEPIGSRCDFEAHISRDRVRLVVAGRTRCEARVSDLRISGPWGVSVEAGGAVEWRRLGVVADGE